MTVLQAADASDKLQGIVAPMAQRLGAALVPLKSMVRLALCFMSKVPATRYLTGKYKKEKCLLFVRITQALPVCTLQLVQYTSHTIAKGDRTTAAPLFA